MLKKPNLSAEEKVRLKKEILNAIEGENKPAVKAGLFARETPIKEPAPIIAPTVAKEALENDQENIVMPDAAMAVPLAEKTAIKITAPIDEVASKKISPIIIKAEIKSEPLRPAIKLENKKNNEIKREAAAEKEKDDWKEAKRDKERDFNKKKSRRDERDKGREKSLEKEKHKIAKERRKLQKNEIPPIIVPEIVLSDREWEQKNYNHGLSMLRFVIFLLMLIVALLAINLVMLAR